MILTSDQRNAKVRVVADAHDVEDLLKQVGWHDVIEPKLTKYKEQLYRSLMQATMGCPVEYDSNNVALTPQHIASRIYGIEWIEALFRSILVAGENAEKALESATFSE